MSSAGVLSVSGGGSRLPELPSYTLTLENPTDANTCPAAKVVSARAEPPGVITRVTAANTIVAKTTAMYLAPLAARSLSAAPPSTVLYKAASDLSVPRAFDVLIVPLHQRHRLSAVTPLVHARPCGGSVRSDVTPDALLRRTSRFRRDPRDQRGPKGLL